MNIKEILFSDLQNVPEIRHLFNETKVLDRFSAIGIRIRMFELHSPSEHAKKKTGRGRTLCGRDRGVRHSYVTCKRCLKKLAKVSSPASSSDR